MSFTSMNSRFAAAVRALAVVVGMSVLCVSIQAAEHDALKLRTKDANAYYHRGLAKIDKGDLDGAIAEFNRAIELDPKYAKAYNNRGNAKIAKGDLDQASADYNRAIDLDPKYANAPATAALPNKPRAIFT